MIGFFTVRKTPVQTIQNIDALDVVGGEYRIAIRISGISVYKIGETEPIFEQELDLFERGDKK